MGMQHTPYPWRSCPPTFPDIILATPVYCCLTDVSCNRRMETWLSDSSLPRPCFCYTVFFQVNSDCFPHQQLIISVLVQHPKKTDSWDPFNVYIILNDGVNSLETSDVLNEDRSELIDCHRSDKFPFSVNDYCWSSSCPICGPWEPPLQS